jgi:hypothetical protein
LYHKHFINKEAFMSLLSNFLGTEEFSLMDSPMFQELVENIKANKIYSVNNEFDYYLNMLGSPKKYKDEIHFTSQLDNQNDFYDLNYINKVDAMSKYIIKNKKSCFSYFPIDSENLITTKESSEVAA